MTKPTPVLLAILDGWGQGPASETNAIHVARTPNMDHWLASFPATTLIAHNGAVGLPEGQMGNSEVGHLNIGAGRVVYQDFTRINRALAAGDFYDNEVLGAAVDKAVAGGGRLHLLGLVSDGGVHSHINHLLGLLELAARRGASEVYIHAFMDGRDTSPTSGAGYLRQLQAAAARIGVGRLATISGRYYAMDRDHRWPRVQLAWEAMVEGQGVKAADPVRAVLAAYERGETDEFIRPIVLTTDDGRPQAVIADNDVVIFFNFRADRVRELTHAFTDAGFEAFDRGSPPQLAACTTFTSYDKHFKASVAFPPQAMHDILGEVVSRHGLRQLRIAETEKYAHVTYFLNGGREEPFALEDRVLIPSPREVATYDQKPEMSAFEVTDELLKRMASETYSLVVLNFANGDMVGHSGKLAAAVKACEVVDTCMGRLVRRFSELGGVVLITADHGNAEMMSDPTDGSPFTAHSSNPVPFILVGERYQGCRLRQDGTLKDIAPTILGLMGLPVPAAMEGTSLIAEALPAGRQ